MAADFDRWEKDPFFPAAEEVQDSADRMESKYRSWILERKNTSDSVDSSDGLRKELQTTLGTTKWQLEEFEQAVESSYNDKSADEARNRHRQFTVAIENQVSKIEDSLQAEEGRNELPWVQLDEGERDELAWFLIGSAREGDQAANGAMKDGEERDLGKVMEEGKLNSSKNLRHSVQLGLQEKSEEKGHGHGRSVSASGDLGALKVLVPDEGTQTRAGLSDGRKRPAIPRIVSFSDFIKTMESAPKTKRSKNGFKKGKNRDCLQTMDTEPLKSHQLSHGINSCFERSPTCLDYKGSHHKQLYGWVGAFQRHILKSQHQFQYSRAFSKTFWVVLICVIGVMVYEAFIWWITEGQSPVLSNKVEDGYHK